MRRGGRVLDRVAELADVAGPVVAEQRERRADDSASGGRASRRHASSSSVAASRARSRGRSRSGGSSEPRGAEPERQVAAEPAGLDLAREIAVRRGDDPQVGRARGRLADPHALAGLEHAQQLGLDRQRQLADLVEEQRAAVRRLEQPAFAATAPVNAPRSWPNSSLSSQRLGIAAQLTDTNGPSRAPDAWIAAAASSLPEPVSPRIRIGIVERASRRASW